MHLSGLDLLLWATGLMAHIILLCVLVVRQRLRAFPIFTTLIVTNICRTAALALVEVLGNRTEYFYTYWSFGLLDTILQLLVVYEMYSCTFRPLGIWAPDVRDAFTGLLLVTTAVAATLTRLAEPQVRLWVQIVVIKSNFFSSVCLSELFVAMLALSVKTGLPSRTHVARISQGLGVYSAIDVLIETSHNYFGVGRDTQIYTLLSHFRMYAYLFCVAYWIVTLWRNAPASRMLPKSLREQLIRLQNIVDRNARTIRVRKKW